MIRSRDYVLFLLTVVFLLIGIGTTLAQSYRLEHFLSGQTELSFVDSADVERTATVSEEAVVSRADRLASLREKIASYGLISLRAPEPTPETVVSTTTVSESVTEPLLCAAYQAFGGVWPNGVEIEEQEGARLVFLAKTAEENSGTTTSFLPSREILAELPIRSASQGGQNCLATDVIGVTLGGALIKNSFISAYAGWDENSLIGYALDGYPIYGVSEVPTDMCGGVVVASEYRYQLSLAREGMINCFSGTPVSL